MHGSDSCVASYMLEKALRGPMHQRSGRSLRSHQSLNFASAGDVRRGVNYAEAGGGTSSCVASGASAPSGPLEPKSPNGLMT